MKPNYAFQKRQKELEKKKKKAEKLARKTAGDGQPAEPETVEGDAPAPQPTEAGTGLQP